MRSTVISGAAGLVAFIALWEVTARANPNDARQPLADGFASLATFGGLPRTLGNAATVVAGRACETLGLVILAVIIAYPIAVLLASALYRLRPMVIAPGAPLLFLRSLPLIALVPIFNRWFGDAFAGQVAYVAWASIVVIGGHVYLALPRVSPALEDAATLFGARGRDLWAGVRWPWVQRELLGSYESLATQIWAFALAAEFLSPSRGLGQMVIGAYQRADLGQLAALVLVYGVLGVLTIAGVRAAINAIPSLRIFTEALP